MGSAVLGIKCGISCMLGKSSTTEAHLPFQDTELFTNISWVPVKCHHQFPVLLVGTHDPQSQTHARASCIQQHLDSVASGDSHVGNLTLPKRYVTENMPFLKGDHEQGGR